MFGLLGNLDEEQRYGLLMAAAQMMQPGPGGNAGAIGRGLQGGLMGYQGARERKDRRLEEAQQREQRGLMMEQMKRQLGQQKSMDELSQRSFGPNPNLVRGDDEGHPMPQAPGGGGFQEYAQGLMGINPQAAMAMQAQLAQMRSRNIKDVSPGASLVDVDTGQSIFTAPNKPDGPKPGQIREVKSGGNIHTYEFDGKGWNKIATAPQFKPESDKPAAPQLYESPNGPVWVTPPGRGGPNVPVTGPDGQPLPGKKREQQLTESQAKGTLFLGQMRGAEESIAALEKGGFDPKTFGNQRDTAIASRAKEAGMVPGAVMNLVAGEKAQQYSQAQEQWSEAFLRIKTGAASTRDEVLRNARTFFPQPGDSAETIKQKNAMRGTANKQMEIIAGHGVDQLDAQTAPKAEAPKQDKPLQKNQTALYKAKQAIASGKDPAAVRQRLIEAGYDPEGL